MAKRKSDGDKLLGIALIALGAACLYYLKAGSDRENNAALVPDALEDRIDLVVRTLNTRVGKDWGNRAIETLKLLLRKVLPVPLVALVDVVYAVEQEARRVNMASRTKRNRAAVMAVAGQPTRHPFQRGW